MNNLQRCEDFLQRVVERFPDQYQDIGELLQRYKNLQSSIGILRRNRVKVEQQNEKLKNEYSRVEKEKTDELVALNTEISQLQKRLEELDHRQKEFSSQIESSLQSNFTENILVARTFMAIDNLYSRCQDINKEIKTQGKKRDAKKDTDEKQARVD